MSKDYTANRIENFLVMIRPWAVKSIPPVEYYAGVMKITAKAKNGTMEAPITDITYLGQAKDREWTPKEVYDYLDGLCPPLAAKMKAVWLDGINVDPST